MFEWMRDWDSVLISRRNCGNVFCKDCCHLKLPIPDQQLYDPVLVCNTCHDLLLESRTRELRSQQLEKAIATASSWDGRSQRATHAGVQSDGCLLEQEPLSASFPRQPRDEALWDWSTRGTGFSSLRRRGVFVTASELEASELNPKGPWVQSPKRGVSSSQMHHTHQTITSFPQTRRLSRGSLFKTNQAATVFKNELILFSIFVLCTTEGVRDQNGAVFSLFVCRCEAWMCNRLVYSCFWETGGIGGCSCWIKAASLHWSDRSFVHGARPSLSFSRFSWTVKWFRSRLMWNTQL